MGIVLSDSEVQKFRSQPEEVAELAKGLCKDVRPFASRAIPEDVRRAILARRSGKPFGREFRACCYAAG